MRTVAKNLLTSTLLLGAGFGLVIASQDVEGPHDFRPYAYFSLPFGAPKSNVKENNFFYGLRLDHTVYGQVKGLAPVAQLALDRYGFATAALNGIPFAYRQTTLNQAEGGIASFTAVDWTLLAIGAVGIGYTIAEVVDQDDSPNRNSSSSSSSSSGSSTGSGGYAEGTGGGFDPFENVSGNPVDAIEEYQKWEDSNSAPAETQQ